MLLTVLLAGAVCINLISGSVYVAPGDVFGIITGGAFDTTKTNIILGIRLPRIGAAVILGGALALSGYLLQTFFDNPIVGPFVLGISSGAKLIVALTLILFTAKGIAPNSMILVGAAFAGAMMAMGFVLVISLKVRSMGILVVCGIMTGYICSAVTDLVVTFADDSNIVNLHNWSLGSLSGMNAHDIHIMTYVIIPCVIITVLMSKPIGAYRLGEAYAMNAGVNIRVLRGMLILISSLLAACVTAFAGPISFVGVAVPHLVKNLVRTTSPAVMIPGCFLMGAVVTLFCDGLSRTVFAPTEVSISSVTAILLVPVVITVMIKRRSGKA